MKLSEHNKLNPGSEPVTSIIYKDNVLDIYGLTGNDVFWVISNTKEIQQKIEDGELKNLKEIIYGANDEAPKFLDKMLCVALQEDSDEIKKAGFNIEQQIDILTALWDFGVPESLKKNISPLVDLIVPTSKDELKE